jgi:hypothetical protein
MVVCRLRVVVSHGAVIHRAATGGRAQDQEATVTAHGRRRRGRTIANMPEERCSRVHAAAREAGD